MRRVIYSAAVSADGYISGPHGEIDWIPQDPEVDFAALFGRFDTLLAGRRTYEAAQAMGGVGTLGMAVYVFSRTLRPEDCPGATLSDNPAGVVRKLKEASGKDLWLFGGGELCRSLLAADLVDGVEMAVTPALLGGGTPFLPSPAERRRLRLENHRVYPQSGIVRLEYSVDPSR